MHPSDKRFAGRLVKHMDEDAADRTGHLVNGVAPDYADYRYRCGYLKAVADLREWIVEEVNKDDPDDPRAR